MRNMIGIMGRLFFLWQEMMFIIMMSKSSRNQKAADSGKLAHIGTKPSKDLSRPFLQSPLYVSMATYTAICHLWLKKNIMAYSSVLHRCKGMIVDFLLAEHLVYGAKKCIFVKVWIRFMPL